MSVENNLTFSSHSGTTFVEASPDAQLLHKPADINLVLETCFRLRTLRALLYAPNMTPNFFDLSSGDAGTILQKLCQYRIRVALVFPAGTVRFSTRFPELVAEENRAGYFHFFESAEDARGWLVQS